AKMPPDAGITATKATGFPAPETHLVPAAPDALLDGGPVQTTVRDRELRDEMRRRILAAWASDAPDESARAAARDGRFVPISSDSEESRRYLRDVVKNAFVPLAPGDDDEEKKK